MIPPASMPCTTFCFVCFYQPAFCRVCVHTMDSYDRFLAYTHRGKYILEWRYVQVESSQKDESRWQSTDSSKAYRNTSAFKCFRHHYVMQKNSSCVETEKSYLCKVLHFNRQNLMLIGPPNDWATAYGS